MVTACLVGSTGLVGSHLKSILALHQSISSVYLFSRKPLPENSRWIVIPKTDPTSWPNDYPPSTDIFFSSLGTTARLAGGFENQRKIDYDLNLDLAKASRKQGTKVYVLISTTGANSTSIIPYSKMRGQLEEAVQAIGFEHTIIVRAGLLVGEREDSRPGEFAARQVATFLGFVSSNKLKDSWAQDADIVAKAAIAAGLEALHGTNTESVRILKSQDIVKLGRTEWQDE